jgi:hypothetical protein
VLAGLRYEQSKLDLTSLTLGRKTTTTPPS